MKGETMCFKKTLSFIVLFLSIDNLFSQGVFQVEIQAQHFKLAQIAYDDMEARGINLAEYTIRIFVHNDTLYVDFSNPAAYNHLVRGSPPGYPIYVYEIDIVSGEIVRVRGIR
jgi:hypothetical protein